MKIGIISFTEQGSKLAEQIFGNWEPEHAGFRDTSVSVHDWAKECFAGKRALVFIGACGIAVRTIAPFVKDKLSDSPVIVIDECGNYVIPILSGHVGGANELAVRIAAKCGAIPVITTATDVHGRFAADVFAGKNALTILNKDGIVKVSSRILRGEQATISVQPDGIPDTDRWTDACPKELQMVAYPPQGETDIVISADPEALERGILRLRPKEYVMGIGCKKGKTAEEIADFAEHVCEDILSLSAEADIGKQLQRGREKITLSDIACAASIDRKKEEPGIVDWTEQNRIPFVTFSEEVLKEIPGEFTTSEFVERQVGVDNVCERAAMAAAGAGGRLIVKKQAANGITLAIARRKWSITFDETDY